MFGVDYFGHRVDVVIEAWMWILLCICCLIGLAAVVIYRVVKAVNKRKQQELIKSWQASDRKDGIGKEL